jgi:hypothetical protein
VIKDVEFSGSAAPNQLVKASTSTYPEAGPYPGAIKNHTPAPLYMCRPCSFPFLESSNTQDREPPTSRSPVAYPNNQTSDPTDLYKEVKPDSGGPPSSHGESSEESSALDSSESDSLSSGSDSTEKRLKSKEQRRKVRKRAKTIKAKEKQEAQKAYPPSSALPYSLLYSAKQEYTPDRSYQNPSRDPYTQGNERRNTFGFPGDRDPDDERGNYPPDRGYGRDLPEDRGYGQRGDYPPYGGGERPPPTANQIRNEGMKFYNEKRKNT